MKLLFVITVTNEDAAAVEKLLDYIRTISGKGGHLVLAIMSNTHEEMKARVRISAQLAFDVIHEMALLPLADHTAPKSSQFNNIFRQVSQFISKGFNWPFLWLDSNCTPKASGWRELLWEAYDAQPRAFFGNKMMFKPMNKDASPIYFMDEVGIYPANAADQMGVPAESSVVPIKVVCSNLVLPKLCMTKLIQPMNLASEGDLLSVREDAYLVTGDKLGLLRNQIKEEANKPNIVKLERNPNPAFIVNPDPLVNRLANGLAKK